MAALTSSTAAIRQTKGILGSVEIQMTDNVIIYPGSVTMATSAGRGSPAAAAASNLNCPGVGTGWGRLGLTDGSRVASDNTSTGPLGSSHTAGGILAILDTGVFYCVDSTAATLAQMFARVYAADDGTVCAHHTQGSNEPSTGMAQELVSTTASYVLINPQVAAGL